MQCYKQNFKKNCCNKLKNLKIFEEKTMDDIERIAKAEKFVECLANGVHPITGEILNEKIFDEPEMIRGLFFVRDVLQDYIPRPKKSAKDKFTLTDNLHLEDILQDNPISLSPFVKKIKELNNGIGPNAKLIWSFLIEKGYLYEETNLDGKTFKIPTELGEQNGLSYVQKSTMYGKSYNVVVYDRQGQELIWNTIKEIYS